MPIKPGSLTIIDREGDDSDSVLPLFNYLPDAARVALKAWLFNRLVIRQDAITLVAPSYEQVIDRPDRILLDARLNGLIGGVLLRSDNGYQGPYEVSSHT